MPLEFFMTDQMGMDYGIKALIYGRSGAGKTHLITTAPNPLLIAAEPGVLTLRGQRIPGIRIQTVNDLTDALEFIRWSAEARQFETVYIDSITEVAEVVLANAKLLNTDPRKAYGELIEKMTMTIKAYRDIAGKHVIMTAKQEAAQDEVTKITSYGPSMPGAKLGPALPYLFDEVFRLGIGKDAEGKDFRFIQAAPDIQYDAKDRSGVLNMYEPADLSVIFSKILAKKAQDGNPQL
jgi:AAA domain